MGWKTQGRDFYRNEKMLEMLKMSEMEEQNRRAVKSCAEKNEVTNAFNILSRK